MGLRKLRNHSTGLLSAVSTYSQINHTLSLSSVTVPPPCGDSTSVACECPYHGHTQSFMKSTCVKHATRDISVREVPEHFPITSGLKTKFFFFSPVASAAAEHQAKESPALSQSLRGTFGPGAGYQGSVPARSQPVPPGAERRAGGERGPVTPPPRGAWTTQPPWPPPPAPLPCHVKGKDVPLTIRKKKHKNIFFLEFK